MKRYDLLAAGLVTAAVAFGGETAIAGPPAGPNIVVIMTDDVGWAISALTAAAPCGERRHPISTGSRPKACAS